jgi:HAD superfamily hydrolase (TIGR01509 family)
VAEVVEAYLTACRERSIREIRVVHGRGIGQLRRTVHARLRRLPFVESYALAGEAYGGSGATIVHLRPDPGLCDERAMNLRVKAVVFDMDGVLTDSEPLINAAAVAMFRERGVPAQPEDFLPFVGTGEDRYLGGVAQKHGAHLDIAAAKHRTYEIYLEMVPRQLEPFPGAVELVDACRRSGLLTAIASSADLIKIRANLDKIGLPQATWSAVVSAEDVIYKKPAPDIFLAAARKLGLSPAECVVVEDAVYGIQAAKAAGMRCLAVAQTFPPAELALADRVFASIRDLAVADIRGVCATQRC